MGGIVVFTVDGPGKMEFVNHLHEQSGGNVDLVIIKKTPQKHFLKRVTGFIQKVGLRGLPRELWFVALWFFSPRIRKTHEWLKARSSDDRYAHVWSPKTMMVDSANLNTDLVYNAVVGVSPKLIVIWGGSIVKMSILSLAERAINMHFGLCPYYRGTNCNHHALLQNDLEHVGITIHDAVETVDAGGIITVVPADISKLTPCEIFCDLNDRGEAAYLNIALRIFRGELIASQPQDLSLGKNYFLKEWTYEKRYRLGKILLEMNSRSNFLV